MANTLVKLDIHLIFHIKSTGVTIRANDLQGVLRYIGGIIRNMDAIPLEIGGMKDHVHILTSLPKTMALTDFVRAIKANTTRWLRTTAPYYQDFSWQEGYGAFSVSPTLTDKTAQYIHNQEQHHHNMSAQEEFERFAQRHGLPTSSTADTPSPEGATPAGFHQERDR